MTEYFPRERLTINDLEKKECLPLSDRCGV